MRTFSCYIHDDRYAAPSLVFYLAETEDEARDMVRRDLLDNPHHRSVEVCEADTLLFVETREIADQTS